MARLRHIAVCVKDLEKAAKFYETVFEMKEVGRETIEIGSAIYMSDGVINLALLNFKGKAGSKASDIKEGTTVVGAHHFGFQVDDLGEIEKGLAKWDEPMAERPATRPFAEYRAMDPDGNLFDISAHGYEQIEFAADRAE